MTQIGIMIEGQDGLNWPRWQQLLRAAEDCGYQCVFRSDHFTNPEGEDKDSLELWISLAYAASHTSRIEFGPLVAPVTFRHPSMNARYAAAVDDLSGGRLVLGMGAGWQGREHQKFGIAFYDFARRYEMLEEALELTRRLLRNDTPSDFQGAHYQLEEAVLLPRPARPGGPPILIGGNGPKRTLPLAAEVRRRMERGLSEPGRLSRAARADGRLYARTGTGGGRDQIFADDAGHLPVPRKHKLDSFLHESGIGDEALCEGRMIVGAAAEVVDQLSARVEAGVERFMLQWMELDDIENLELLARDVLPQFSD